MSIEVAKSRNICQACLNDMQYGLPVGVRDKLLRDGKLGGDSTAIAGKHFTIYAPVHHFLSVHFIFCIIMFTYCQYRRVRLGSLIIISKRGMRISQWL